MLKHNWACKSCGNMVREYFQNTESLCILSILKNLGKNFLHFENTLLLHHVNYIMFLEKTRSFMSSLHVIICCEKHKYFTHEVHKGQYVKKKDVRYIYSISILFK